MEKLIQQYMKKLGISREDAIQLIEDDKADYIGEEGEQMTQQAKAIRRYEKAEEQKPRKPRERKVDEVKKDLIEYLVKALELVVECVTSVKGESEIHFTHKNEKYTIKLIKHRKKGT